ncbi:hypothetical protein [Allokutzneria sp. NRRL B-24872]|uniref:hypothetical protein n=1 Tax=Allokutzneria sp. NRRL B-24872 TaxID=1137961 RepID=UPI000A37EBEF|nr:hypothetical protein [Allokutzneria sp. NRRL B-24872]
MVVPKPEFRQSARELAEDSWREPVTVVFLDDVKPGFDVPGRRKDGTLKGRKLIRRFFWNIVRGTVGGVVNAFLVMGSGEWGSVFGRDGSVTGPENAQALGLVDAARSARSPWLVVSASHVAVIDTGLSFADPTSAAPPTVLWHEAAPHAPKVILPRQRIRWRDGSEFHFHLSPEEAALLRRQR